MLSFTLVVALLVPRALLAAPEPDPAGPDPFAETETPPEPSADDSDFAPDEDVDDGSLPEEPPAEELEPAPRSAVETERAPGTRAEDRDTSKSRDAEAEGDDPGFDRIGFLLAGSVGVTSCAQPMCALIPVGGLGRAELGYRHRRFAPVFSIALGGAPIDVPDEAVVGPDLMLEGIEGSLRFLDVGVALQFFPVVEGRVDPFIHAGLSYSRITARASSDDSELVERFSRGAARLGGGLLVYVGRHVALGPRFDGTLPFAGEYCVSLDGEAVTTDGHVCDDTSHIIDSAMTSIDERTIRKSFPKPWSVTLALRAVF